LAGAIQSAARSGRFSFESGTRAAAQYRLDTYDYLAQREVKEARDAGKVFLTLFLNNQKHV